MTDIRPLPGTLRTLRAPYGFTKGSIVYFMMFQLIASAGLLIGHFAVTVRNQFTRSR